MMNIPGPINPQIFHQSKEAIACQPINIIQNNWCSGEIMLESISQNKKRGNDDRK
jgi:hypothetical protein